VSYCREAGTEPGFDIALRADDWNLLTAPSAAESDLMNHGWEPRPDDGKVTS